MFETPSKLHVFVQRKFKYLKKNKPHPAQSPNITKTLRNFFLKRGKLDSFVIMQQNVYVTRNPLPPSATSCKVFSGGGID